MRISDWSSDVCSSDLGAGATVREATKRGGHSRRLPAAAPCHGGWHASCVLSPCTRSGKREGAQAGNRNRAGQAHYGVATGPNVGGHSAPFYCARGLAEDRKSYVEGKSVAGRVDLG